MSRLNRALPEPETRVGNCCGCHKYFNLTLYKVPGIFRYRCGACYQREVGYPHYLSIRPIGVSS